MNATKKSIDDVILLANDAHGVYMTKVFLDRFKDSDNFILHESFNEDIETVLNSDPYETEWYFNDVDNILNNVKLNIDGCEYFTMFAEGGLWAIPEDVEQEELDEWLGC